MYVVAYKMSSLVYPAKPTCYVSNRRLFNSLSSKSWNGPEKLNKTEFFCHPRTWPAWVVCARSQLHLRFLDICTCILPHLPRFKVIEIEALSIRNDFDHQSGIDVEEKILFRVERHALAGEGFEIKWRFFPTIKADFFLRISEAIPRTLW